MAVDNIPELKNETTPNVSPFAEKERESPRLINLLNMTDQERNKFIAKLNRSGGHAQVWIHTHYKEDYLPTGAGYSSQEKAEKYAKDRDQMIREHGSNTMPVIAFIESKTEEGFLDKYKKFYGLTDNNDREIYYVLTLEGNPTPNIYVESKFFADFTFKTLRDIWGVFAGYMKQLGLKHVLLSGRNYYEHRYIRFFQKRKLRGVPGFEIARQQFDKGHRSAYHPMGCVGFAYNEFVTNGIPVTLSIVYPETPNPQIRRSEAEGGS